MSFVEKMAKKTFESAMFQKSWQGHMQAFGPILEPAFVDNYSARVNLTAALNLISNGNTDKGFKKLKSMEKSCSTDADRAAWFFCMGLCCEIDNAQEQMVAFYHKAGQYGHQFYLPNVKIAKAAHGEGSFEFAEEYYVKAIDCLKNAPSDESNRSHLGSVYTNYASCLTFMHRYQEAEEAFKLSKELKPILNGRAREESILASAVGDAHRAKALLETAKAESTYPLRDTEELINDIFEQKSPYFNKIDVPKENIDAFWEWFTANEEQLLFNLRSGQYDAIFQAVQPKLKETFPFMDRDLEFGMEPHEEYCKILFADFFMVSLEHGYSKLLAETPKSLEKNWRFELTR